MSSRQCWYWPYLKGQAKGLVAGTLGGLDQVKRLQKGGALVPAHVVGLLNHVVTLEPRDGHEVDLQGKSSRCGEERIYLHLNTLHKLRLT